MGLDLRLPNITGATEREQLAQIKSYLIQLVEQLQWALKNVDTSSNTIVATPIPRSLLPAETNTTTKDSQATFDSIKALIIKSSEIVEAYYNEISSRLSSEYVAQSDFGNYIEQIEQVITENSTEVEQNFTHIQQILTDIESISYKLSEVNAHIKAGLLYYDDAGLPIFGFEIGQKNVIDGVEVFNKYARFTSDTISFYQNGVVVAYISDYKLHITHAEVTGTLKIGGYLVDTSKGLTFKWVGRS